MEIETNYSNTYNFVRTKFTPPSFKNIMFYFSDTHIYLSF